MGKNYRNRTLPSMQIRRPSTPRAAPSKRKESTTSCSSSVSTVSRTSARSGESIFCSLVSERPPENCSRWSRKTPEGYLKAQPCSTGCTAMAS